MLAFIVARCLKLFRLCNRIIAVLPLFKPIGALVMHFGILSCVKPIAKRAVINKPGATA